MSRVQRVAGIWRAAGAAAGLIVLAFGAAALAPAAGPLPHRGDLAAEECARVAKVTAPTDDFSAAETFEIMPAGAGTSRRVADRDAFSHSLANLSFAREQNFKRGNGLFRKVWVPAPSPTQASDGLGPLFNARSCQRCHLKDGRGHPPAKGEKTSSMFLRLAIPPQDDADRTALADKSRQFIPDPVYGEQLQAFAIAGLKGEGDIAIDYEEVEVALAGGETVWLRKPSYTVADLGYGPLHPQATLSPRIAPPMIGLGLIEQIHEGDILARADPDDADGDGISGRANMVRDPRTGTLVAGRFGWKASGASIRQQAADALAGDIGISSAEAPRHAGDCTAAQTACAGLATGVQARLGDTEAPGPVIDLIAFYSRNLAVPARRDVDDKQVLRGKRLFYEAGCVSCHTPKYVTRRDAPQEEHRFQLIWPYTDLLLHDMGAGLADGQAVGDASGREWRTPPLWGIGLTQTVSGHTRFLHDGRARNLLEAVLWHGGEARAARDRVAAMSARDRAALIRFLESL